MTSSFSNPMFKTFKEDLKKNETFFLSLPDKIKKNQLSESDLKEFKKIFHEIIGITKLLQIFDLEVLSKILHSLFSSKDFFDFMKDHEFFTNFMKAIHLFLELGTLPEAQLNAFLKRNSDFIKIFEKQSRDFLAKKEKIKSILKPESEEKDLTSDSAMIDLFKIELETQAKLLNEELILYEQSREEDHFQALMRAAHSIKGASKVLNLNPLIQLAHILEECFVNAKQKKMILEQHDFDILFEAADFFTQLSKISNKDLIPWIKDQKENIDLITQKINQIIVNKNQNEVPLQNLAQALKNIKNSSIEAIEAQTIKKVVEEESDRVLRVRAQSLNRLMGLAGESMVESRWLNPFSDSLLKLKKNQNELSSLFENLKENLKDYEFNEIIDHYIIDIQQKILDCRNNLSDRLSELELFISRHSSLTDRLYNEVIESRMRPFADGVEAFPRMVRDLARELNKKVKLEILGKNIPVDRDILEKLETPLSHLLRNSLDHGIEPPPLRIMAGKPIEGTITIEARHLAGMLAITFSDDGRGLDFNKIRQTIVEKKMIKEEMAEQLSENELLEFLFLPGFTTSTSVTEISGRGIGLNIVHNMVQELTGTIRIINRPGQGLTINLQLPLTLSIIRALIANISGEPYAFPLGRIEQAIMLSQTHIKTIENRQFFNFHGINTGILSAAQVLNLKPRLSSPAVLSVIILSDHSNLYGLVVDSFLGEKETVVHELDPRLGKIQNISAGSLLEDGSPVLIVDVDDMVQSIDLLLSEGNLPKISYEQNEIKKHKKRILVVDDSLTVREVESRLLRNQGYEVETAVNGVDAWNAIRIGNYNLIITDVDMPRMNGIELVRNIKADTRFKNLPIMIVSYKEREGDRLLGLEAGANYYLTKSSFHDETLLKAVIDLIGAS